MYVWEGTMIRKIILTISGAALLMFFSVSLSAQNYEAMAKKGQSEKLLTAVNEALVKAPDDIRLNFYKGKAYSEKETSSYQVDSSYKYFNKALELYGVLKDQEIREKLYSEAITPVIIKNQINSLLNDAFAEVFKINTLEGYSAFIARYPESNHTREAQMRYDQLRFQSFCEVKRSMKEFQDFYLNNPGITCRNVIGDSIGRNIHRNAPMEELLFFVTYFPDHSYYIAYADRLYNYFRKDGELLSLMKYYELIGDVPMLDQQRNDYELARFAWGIGLTASKNASKGCFGGIQGASAENEELNRRLTREGAQGGDLQFSLMWNNYNDIDLHVIDPNREEIYYRHRSSASGGLLDVDMNVYYKAGRYSDQPVENIFWPASAAPSGHYIVDVVHYKNHRGSECKDPTDYTVRIRCNGQDTLIKGSISFDNIPRQEVLEFDYQIPERFTPEWNDTLVKKYDQYIKAAAPRELAFVAVLKLMSAPLRSGNWEEASRIMSVYARYFTNDNNIMSRIRETDKMIKGNLYAIQKEKVANINTKGEEYSPVPGADEKTLYFCGRGRTDNLGKEDIFVSTMRGTEWSAPVLLNSINTAADNEAPLSVSVDGNILLLFQNGDIYYAEKNRQGWSAPKAFAAPVNSEFWEGDAMLTADGKAIIFASNRPGGKNLHVNQNYYHGNINYASDLYVCEKTANGWGPAINLGAAINTAYCERSPLLHADLKTLYFSSDGHYGLGDLDVFMVKRSSDTSWTQWGVPVNLGKYINTADGDWGYRVSSSGQWAYFSAVDVATGSKEDVFRFELPAELRPEPVIALSGRLTDNHGNNVSALIHWINLVTGEETGVATSDPRTGRYFILLPAGTHYGYFADSGSYFSVSDHIDLTNDRNYHIVNQDISLYRVDELVESGKPLRINNLFFDYDKSSLRSESFPELNRLAAIIRSNAGLKIEIMGHTDDAGPDDYNMTLSESRAKSVMAYLISKNVPAASLLAKGYGETKPMLPNTSDNNRQMNRRVEFRFFR